MSGRSGDVLYATRMVVSRTWVRTEDGWRVLGEHISIVEPDCVAGFTPGAPVQLRSV